MEEAKKPSTNLPPTSKWIRRPDSAEVYSNQFFIDWTVTDVRVRFGQMTPTDRPENGKVGFAIEERAAISMAWAQTKALRDGLINAVERYEKANGLIDLAALKLPE
jgi:hypothetical protein